MVVKLNNILIKKGEKLKAPYYASTAAICNYITICNIVPTVFFYTF